MGSAYRCVSMEKLRRFDEPRGPGANRTTLQVQLMQVTDT